MNKKFNKIAFLLAILLVRSENICAQAQGSRNPNTNLNAANPNTNLNAANPNNNLNVGNSNSNQFSGTPGQPSDSCIECICRVMSGCNKDRYSCNREGTICGPFNITEAFWSTGGSPTIPANSNQGVVESEFQRCANEKSCASKAVKQALSIYSTDCNNDGVITCSDYLAIHMLGARNCANFFTNRGYTRFQQTLSTCEQSNQVINSNQVTISTNRPTAVLTTNRLPTIRVPQQCIDCFYNILSEVNVNPNNCNNLLCESDNTRQVNAELDSCISRKTCTSNNIEKYLSETGRDCNNDRIINCLDFIAIYALGSENCTNYFTDPKYFSQRQNIENTVLRCIGVEANNDNRVVSANINPLGSSPSASSLPSLNPPLECLKCIYDDVKRQFNTSTEPCSLTNCGPLHISQQNWISAGQPSIEPDIRAEFEPCANNRDCTLKVVVADIQNNVRDCNNDNKVDCLDYLAMITSRLETCENFFNDDKNSESIKFVSECVNPAKVSSGYIIVAPPKWLSIIAINWILSYSF